MIGIPDIATTVTDTVVIDESQYAGLGVTTNSDANHKANVGVAAHVSMPQTETVIIAAPGKIPKYDHSIIARGSFPVITIGSAIRQFEKPAYCVIADWSAGTVQYLDGVDLSETIGVLSTSVQPEVVRLGWRETTWYTNLPRRADGLPYCYTTEGVITDAVWFAVKQLGATRVILVGVEQPATIRNYFWEGIFLQAHCFFYCKHGVKIWNCTPATSVLAGVILGSLEEACRSQSQLQPLI